MRSIAENLAETGNQCLTLDPQSTILLIAEYFPCAQTLRSYLSIPSYYTGLDMFSIINGLLVELDQQERIVWDYARTVVYGVPYSFAVKVPEGDHVPVSPDPSTLPAKVVEVLEQALKLDSRAMSRLFSLKVVCINRQLGEHPHVIVENDNGKDADTLSVLGILNGVLGYCGSQHIVAAKVGPSDELVGFTVVPRANTTAVPPTQPAQGSED